MANTVPADSARNGSHSRSSSRSHCRTGCISLTLESLPFSSHPLFQQRRCTIIAAVIGAVLVFFGGSSYWGLVYYGPMYTNFLLLVASAVFCALDLICWVLRKKENPDQDPDRPTGKWAMVDLIMAVLLFFVFWPSIGDNNPYHYDMNVIGLYGALADLVCSVLHAWSFWKQLMNHKKQIWLSELNRQSCARCGYTEEQNDPPASSHHPEVEHANVFPNAGPSADFGRANVLTPESPESAMEEGLLIGSDFGSDYGSVQRAEPVLEPPEEIIVGKGKKKLKGGSSRKGSVKGSTL